MAKKKRKTKRTRVSWQAEMDARTLMEAEIIKSSSSRYRSALKALKKLASKEKAEVEAVEKLLKTKSKKAK